MAEPQIVGQQPLENDDISKRVSQIFTCDLATQPEQDSTQLLQYEWDDLTHRQDVAKNLIERFTQEQHQTLVDQKCDEFYNVTRDRPNHFDYLDRTLSSLLRCRWRVQDVQIQQKIVQDTSRYLQRLDCTPTPLPGAVAALPEDFFCNQERTWQNLHVVSRISSSTIRFIIVRVACENRVSGWTDSFAQDTLNRVGELLESVSKRSKGSTTQEDRNRWFVVRAFLWAFWQRCRIFYTSIKLSFALRHQIGYGNDPRLWFVNFDLAENVSLKKLTEISAISNRPDNLCSWTLELLRADPQCLGLDFNLLHERYRSVLGSAPIRCSASGKNVCNGSCPERCLRYKGLKIDDQSQHDGACKYRPDDEPRLVWDKESYLGVSGARAVSIASTDTSSGKLKYCNATSQTIAISHVWIHGQGGRPHEGINLCLHQRYTSIASELGCDSY